MPVKTRECFALALKLGAGPWEVIHAMNTMDTALVLLRGRVCTELTSPSSHLDLLDSLSDPWRERDASPFHTLHVYPSLLTTAKMLANPFSSQRYTDITEFPMSPLQSKK